MEKQGMNKSRTVGGSWLLPGDVVLTRFVAFGLVDDD